MHFYDDQTDNYFQHHYQLLFSHQFNSNWYFNAAAHFTKGDGYYQEYIKDADLTIYKLLPAVSDLTRKKSMDNGFGGGVFDVTYKNDRLQTTFGGGVNKYTGWNYGQVLYHEFYRYRGEKWDGNLYAKADYNFCKGLNGYLDLQWRHIDYRLRGENERWDYELAAPQNLNITRVYDFFNPKVGLNYQFKKNHRVYASWSVAHKEPTRNNFITDLNVKPVSERLFDYEAGYEFSNEWLHAGANLYYMDYKDQLVLTGKLNEIGEPLSENVPESYRMGVELSFGLKTKVGFSWDISATLSRNRVKNFVETLAVNDYDADWNYMGSRDAELVNHGDTHLAFSPDYTFVNVFRYAVKGFEVSTQTNFVSKQYMSNANQDNPMDVTFLVQDAFFGKGTDYNTVWNGSVALGGPVNNNCAERFNMSSFEIYQTITGVPNGIYKVTCSGFYRYGDGAAAASARDASDSGVEPLLAKYYINSTEAPLMSIFADDITLTNNSTYNTSSAVTVGGTNYYLPSNMNRAAACFANGCYVNDLIQAVVTDGTVRIGLKKTEAKGSDWAIFDNVKLYYYGIDLSAIKADALAQWDEYNALVVENGDRTTYDATLTTIKSLIQDATDEVTIGNAVKGLKPAYQIYQSSPEVIGAPLNLTSMFTNANLKGGATGWTVTSTGNAPSFDTGLTPAALEAYAGWDNLAMTAFKIEQTESITLAPGKYRLRVNAFYRYGLSYNSDGETPTSLAYLYAGDNRQEIMRLGDLASNEYPNKHSKSTCNTY